MDEIVEEDRRESGLSILQMHGAPGYQMEHISVEDTLHNGLRIQISNDGEDEDSENSNGWWAFHFQSRDAAEMVGKRLLELAAAHDWPNG